MPSGIVVEVTFPLKLEILMCLVVRIVVPFKVMPVWKIYFFFCFNRFLRTKRFPGLWLCARWTPVNGKDF